MFYVVELIEQKMHTVTVEADSKEKAEALAWDELMYADDVETEDLPAYVANILEEE